MIEIDTRKDQGLEVTVTRTCDKPETIEFTELVLEEMRRLSPQVIIKRSPPATTIATVQIAIRKRGGPAGTPDEQKVKIVRGWLKLQGRMNQEVYAHGQGITASTLRRWVRQLRREGKL